MLRKLADKDGKDWDKLLSYLLFAYREVPQSSTGVFPFELLYGRHVRGPLDVLKQSWESSSCDDESNVSYVMATQKQLEKMTKLVKENMQDAQRKQNTRQLNAATQGDAYQLQRVDELLDRLGGSQFLTTLDLATGRQTKHCIYNSIYGLFQFKGLEEYAAAYIDDLNIFGSSWEDHLYPIRGVILERLRKAHVITKSTKC
ncbi:hypothetical protein EMCRGX_G015092 [Ephydatia muelleri]